MASRAWFICRYSRYQGADGTRGNNGREITDKEQEDWVESFLVMQQPLAILKALRGHSVVRSGHPTAVSRL